MRTLTQSILLLCNPKAGWHTISADAPNAVGVFWGHCVPLALLPAGCWYVGVTHQGWQVAGQTMRLTASSAIPICVLFYLAMLAGVLFLAAMVHWMAGTYRDELASSPSAQSATAAKEGASFSAALQVISYSATPFFIAGLLGLYPLLWVDLIVGTAVALWCIYLLFVGIPIVLEIPTDRSFLYASAVLAVALVAFVGLLSTTILLWDIGPAPEFTY